MRHPIDRELEYTYSRLQPSAMNTHTPLRGATEAPKNRSQVQFRNINMFLNQATNNANVPTRNTWQTPTANPVAAPVAAAGRANTIQPPHATQQGWNNRTVRGYTMPPIAAPPTITHGIMATEDHHRETMMDRLMTIVYDALGTALVFPDGYKPPIKGDNIKKYSGSPKYSELEEWLIMVTHRYALQKLGGGNANTDCV